MTRGKQTAQAASALHRELAGSGFLIYYHHGNTRAAPPEDLPAEHQGQIISSLSLNH